MNDTVENLADASFKIRGNKEFLQLAVKINPEDLKFVTNDKDIKNDRFFIITALSSKNKDIVAKGVKWLSESEEFKNDDELVSLAVKNDGLALKNLSKKYTEDKTIVLSAIKNNPLAIIHMDSELFNDSEIILFAFDRFNRINSEHNMILSIFSKISDKLNPEVVLAASYGMNYNPTTFSNEYSEVIEREIKSTQACSCCGEKTGPKGLEGLSVSQWTCVGCGVTHNRNENSAYNHLLAWQPSQREAERLAMNTKAKKKLLTALESKLL